MAWSDLTFSTPSTLERWENTAGDFYSATVTAKITLAKEVLQNALLADFTEDELDNLENSEILNNASDFKTLSLLFYDNSRKPDDLSWKKAEYWEKEFKSEIADKSKKLLVTGENTSSHNFSFYNAISRK